MRFGLTSSSPSTGEESFVDKHFRNASRSRLIAYAVVCLAILVVVLLWLTLSGGDDDAKYKGRDALKESPLVDGFGGFPWQIHSRFKDSLTNLDLEKLIKDASNNTLQSNLADLTGGFVSAQVWEVTEDCDSKYPLLSAMLQQDLINRIVKKSSHLKIARSSSDICSAFDEKKTAIFSSLNGGHLIEDKIALLRIYYDNGIRIFSINKFECLKTSKFAAVADATDATKYSLTKFAETAISELNRLGIVIDLTGSDTNTQVEVLKKTKAPVIFSHSVSSLSADNPYIVKNEVMQQLKTNNGLLMLNFGSEQLATTSTKPPDTATLIQHLSYIRDKFGADYIGIGAGFDSSEQFKPILKSPSEYPDLFDKLAEGVDKIEPWSETDLKKLAGQNFERIFKDVEKVRDDSVDLKPFEYEEPEKKEEEKKEDEEQPKQ